jgi:hypothetical protein
VEVVRPAARVLSLAVTASVVVLLAPAGPGWLPHSTTPPGPAPRAAPEFGTTPAAAPSALSPHWTNLTGSSLPTPACRDSEGLVFDSALEEVVMFGGISQCGSEPNSVAENDTWTYTGGTWTNITASAGTAPSPRWGMAMVYDTASGQVVLFGGADTYGNVNDQTWVFDGRWAQLALNGTSPPALYGAGATYDPSLRGVLLYGGQAGFAAGPGTIYNATWLFHGGTWTPQSAPGPDPLRSPTLVYDAAANASLLFGGFDGTTGTPSNETWSFANGTWSLLPPTNSPPARFAAGAAYDPLTGAIVLFGGFTFNVGNSNSALSDTWVFLNGTWMNATAGSPTSPSARAGDRLVWDVADGYGILLGGQSSGYRYSDTWTFT